MHTDYALWTRENELSKVQFGNTYVYFWNFKTNKDKPKIASALIIQWKEEWFRKYNPLKAVGY